MIGIYGDQLQLLGAVVISDWVLGTEASHIHMNAAGVTCVSISPSEGGVACVIINPIGEGMVYRFCTVFLLF